MTTADDRRHHQREQADGHHRGREAGAHRGRGAPRSWLHSSLDAAHGSTPYRPGWDRSVRRSPRPISNTLRAEPVPEREHGREPGTRADRRRGHARSRRALPLCPQRRPLPDGGGLAAAPRRRPGRVYSGGSDPGPDTNPTAIAAMAEVGIDISRLSTPAVDRRRRPGRRRRRDDGLRRRLPRVPRKALRGLGADRPGRPADRGGPRAFGTRSGRGSKPSSPASETTACDPVEPRCRAADRPAP